MRHTKIFLGFMLVGFLGLVGTVDATELPIGQTAWVIESADYTGEIEEQIARLEAVYTIKVLQDGWVEIPLKFSNATVTSIEGKKGSNGMHIIPRGGSYALATTRKGTYKVTVKFSTLLVQDSQFEGVQIGIPQATFSTVTLSVPRKDVELRKGDELYVERQGDGTREGVKLIARVGAATTVDLRWRTRPADPIKIEPVLYGEVHTLVTLEEQLARLMSVVEYRIAQGETKTLTIDVPSTVNILHVRGSGVEDWRVSDSEGKKILKVTLGFPLKDTTYRLIIEGEETYEKGSTEYQLPEIRLSDVKQERGHLAVARLGSIEITPKISEGITRVDVKELPELLRAGTSTQAILAFRYHQHPYELVLEVTRHEDHPVLAGIAEQGEFVTVLTRQGTMLTRATYLIKANKKQFLGIVLPEGATLWSCIVDGKSVKPVKGEEDALRIPLDAAQDSARAVTVELVYFETRPPFTRYGKFNLQGPVLDIPTTVSNWSLYAPRSLKFLRFGGNLERGGAQFGFVDEPFVQLARVNGSEREFISFEGKSGSDIHHDAMSDSTSYSMDGEGDMVGRLAASGERGIFSKTEASKLASGNIRRAVEGMAVNEPTATYGDDKYKDVVAAFDRLSETGILPLKIRLPKSGRLYQFNRLMTAQEALQIQATFVHLPIPWVPIATVGLFLVPVGGFAVYRIKRG